MKLKGDFRNWTVSQTALGQVLNLTPGRINQLIDEKIVVADDSEKGAVFLVESMQNYYLSKKNYEDGKGKVNFWEERGLHERAKRKLAELKLKKARGEIYDAPLVDSVLAEVFTNFKNKILGIPAKLSPQLQGKSVAQVHEILTAELDDILIELSENLESADFNEEVFENSEENSAGDKVTAEIND